jgi:hypothetical protein
MSAVIGRWTIMLCKDCGQRAHYQNRCPKDRRRVWTEMVEVPVVPCDDAAVERAMLELYELGRGQKWPGVLEGGIAVSHVGIEIVVKAVLRAAGETP